MTPAPASGDLNSHPELSAWRSLCVLMMQSSCSIMCAQWPLKLPRMSVMRDSVRTPSVYQVWSSKATPFRRYGYFGSWPSDVHWPLTFWPWNWCGISAVVLTTVLPILVFLLVFVVEQCINIRQTDDMTLLLWPSTFWGHGACHWCGHRAPFLYHVWSSSVSPLRRHDTFSVSALIGLETLTFDLSTSKWHLTN